MNMQNKTANSLEVKKVNRNTIFQYLYKNDQLSKHDIAYALDISFPTVTQNLKELKNQDLIIENGLFDSTGGRKAKAISYNPNARYAIGVDVTKNHLGIVVINLGGEIIKNSRIRNQFENTDQYFKTLGLLIEQIVEDTKIDPAKICGVGIAVPGILSDDKKIIMYSPKLGFTGGTRESFEKYIPYPCLLCNDANAAGLAELWNSGKANNVVYLSLSNSVGGSVLINNNLYFGENQRSGEFGHMTIVPEGRQCYCGQKGCVDTYCSALILSESANGNIAEFFDLLKSGSKQHEVIWQEYLKYLVITINNLRMLFDCSVIIGGYVGSYMEDYIEDLRKMVGDHNPFENDGAYLKACSYKKEAIAVGAGLMHIEHFINNI